MVFGFDALVPDTNDFTAHQSQFAFHLNFTHPLSGFCFTMENIIANKICLTGWFKKINNLWFFFQTKASLFSTLLNPVIVEKSRMV
jgi:hypothetical protein